MSVDVTINRDKYIGGSDLPAILGLNKQFGKSIIQFAKEKLNIIPKEFSKSPYTEYGHIMEGYMRAYMNEMMGVNFVEDTAINEEKHYRGNCDGIDRDENLLLECKTFHGKLKVDYYTPQCQFYMELFNIDTCYLVGYERPKDFYFGIDITLENDTNYFDTTFDASRLVIFKINRDREYFKKLEVEIEKFKYLLECLKEEEILNGENGVTSKAK